MKVNSAVTSAATPQVAPRQGRVFIGIGGAFSDVMDCPEAANAHVVLHIDVSGELRGARGVGKLALASNETVATLLASMGQLEDLERMARRPGLNLNTGLARARAIGRAAARKLVADPQFQNWVFENIVRPLRAATQCAMQEVVIIVASSLVGGTGGPSSEIVGQAIVAEFIEQVPNTVTQLSIRIGAATFNSLVGRRGWWNVAAALAEDYRHFREPRARREIRRGIYSELPDHPRRGMLAAQMIAALNSASIVEETDRVESNDCSELPLGNLSVVQSGFFNAMDANHIRSAVAKQLVGDLREMSQLPGDRAWVQNLIVRPSSRGTMTVAVSLSDKCGVVYDVDAANDPEEASDVIRDLDPARAFAEFQRNISRCRGMLDRLADEIATRTAALTKAQRDHDHRAAEHQEAQRQLNPRGVRAKVAAMIADAFSPGERVRHATTAQAAAESTQTPIAQLKAEIATLKGAQSLFAARLNSELSRLNCLRDALLACRQSGDAAPAVIVRPLSEVFDALMARIGKDFEFGRQLARCVQSVTREGLRVIAGADHAAAKEIIGMLDGVAPLESPPFGGQYPRTPTTRTFVLPPVEPALADELREEALRLSEPPAIAFVSSDCATAGFNAVVLKVSKPFSVSDLLTRVHLNDLKKVIHPERLPDYITPERASEIANLVRDLTAVEAPSPEAAALNGA